MMGAAMSTGSLIGLWLMRLLLLLLWRQVMMVAWLKVRRYVGRQLLHHDGMAWGHVGNIVVVIGGGVGIRLRRVAVGRGGGGRRAGLARHVKLQAPPGIVGGVAGSEDAAF